MVLGDSRGKENHTFSLQHLEQWADMVRFVFWSSWSHFQGCKNLTVAYCEAFPTHCQEYPSDYLKILCLFEYLAIETMKQYRQLSLIPIIQIRSFFELFTGFFFQMMMTAEPEVPLRYLVFPFCTYFLKEKELEHMHLERWRFDTEKHVSSASPWKSTVIHFTDKILGVSIQFHHRHPQRLCHPTAFQAKGGINKFVSHCCSLL